MLVRTVSMILANHRQWTDRLKQILVSAVAQMGDEMPSPQECLKIIEYLTGRGEVSYIQPSVTLYTGYALDQLAELLRDAVRKPPVLTVVK